MTERAKLFAEKLSSDEALKAELTAALQGVENAEQIPILIEFAKKKGYELTKEDLIPEQENISTDELDSIVGGARCICMMIGAGGGDGLSCGCGVGGYGRVLDEFHLQGTCVCVIPGSGSNDPKPV